MRGTLQSTSQDRARPAAPSLQGAHLDQPIAPLESVSTPFTASAPSSRLIAPAPTLSIVPCRLQPRAVPSKHPRCWRGRARTSEIDRRLRGSCFAHRTTVDRILPHAHEGSSPSTFEVIPTMVRALPQAHARDPEPRGGSSPCTWRLSPSTSMPFPMHTRGDPHAGKRDPHRWGTPSERS